jgi:hypothetical protein
MVVYMHARTPTRAGTVRPPPRIALAVRDLIEQHGEPAAATRLGIGRTAVVRIAARLPARRGTVTQAAHALGFLIDDEASGA